MLRLAFEDHHRHIPADVIFRRTHAIISPLVVHIRSAVLNGRDKITDITLIDHQVRGLK